MDVLFTYNCTNFDIKRCEDFSRNMTESKKTWQKRHYTNPKKLHRDTVLSKLGEVGAAQYLRSKGFFAAEPDFAIYAKKDKSYAPDFLLPGSTGVEVKTQDVTQARKYGTSWIFSNFSPCVRELTHDLVLFCTYKHNRGVPQIQVVSCVSTQFLQENNLYKPTLQQNNAIKCAVYGEDLLGVESIDVATHVSKYRMRALSGNLVLL